MSERRKESMVIREISLRCINRHFFVSFAVFSDESTFHLVYSSFLYDSS